MAITFDASGSGSVTSAITALTTATEMYGKHMRDVGTLVNMPANSSWTVASADDNSANPKFEIYVLTGSSVGGSNTLQISLNAYNVSSANTFPTFSALPPSGPVIFSWFFTPSTCGIALYAPGSQIGATTHGGGVLNNATGYFRINKIPIAHGQGSSRACTCEGDGIYSGAPYDTTFTSANWYAAPTTGDTNIIGMWKENDAFSGTSPSTIGAQVGSQAMTPTSSHYNWAAGAGQQWFGPPAAPPPRGITVNRFIGPQQSSF